MNSVSRMTLLACFIFSIFAGTIASSLFNVNENVFIFLFFVFMVLIYDDSYSYLLTGVILALIAEAPLAIHTGDLAVGFVLLIFIKEFISRVVALPRLTQQIMIFQPSTALFLGTVFLFLIVLMVVVGSLEHLIYGVTYPVLSMFILKPLATFLTVTAQALALLIVFAIFSRRRTSLDIN